MFKLDFKKAEEPEIKLPTPKKASTSASLTTLKPLTVWITTNCGKFFKRREHQTTLPASWETCLYVKKQQLEPNMEQWTGSILGREYIVASAPVLCPLDEKNLFIGKDLDAAKDWRQEGKGMTEDEMVRWQHQLNGHEMSLSKLWELVMGRPGTLQSVGSQRVEHD